MAVQPLPLPRALPQESESVPMSEGIKRVINSSGRSLPFGIDECDQQTIQMSIVIKALLGAGCPAEKLMQSDFSLFLSLSWV